MKKIVYFLIFNVLFSLLPILIVGLISIMVTEEYKFEYNYIPELLFYTLMICSTTLLELAELRNTYKGDIILGLFNATLMLLCIIASIFYGCSIMITYVHINFLRVDFLQTVTFGVAIMSTILSIGTKIFVSKIER